MGRLHARVLGQLPDHFDLRGFADPALAQAPFASAEALIASVALVIIATPTASHARLTQVALERGRAVLVEKPLATSATDARKLAAAPGAGRLFVGHSERFHPVVRAIRAELARTPSTIESIEIERTIPSTGARAEEDVLLNLGVHDLDLVEHLTGARMRVVSADGDATNSRVVLESGAVRAIVRCARAGAPTRRIRVATGPVTFEGDLLQPRLSGQPYPIVLPTDEPLVAQALALHAATIADFASDCVLATAHEGARAVDLATAAVGLRNAQRAPVAASA